MSSILSWENSKKAALGAEWKKIEEKFEKKKAECREKMRNKEAKILKEAQEKRAKVTAAHEEEILRTEETSAKYLSSGHTLKKPITCFAS
ncbi:remorin [Canna indica]|uniref:Remorin n=1 Tax=Canna indica TaxID=4628 RepID=A0AAQ3KBF4_9LILI|nr:remorin [Canna indica]